MYCKARVLGYQRGKHSQYPTNSLLQIENVSTTKDATFYLGKRVAYMYHGKRAIKGTKVRVIWGKITRTHGNSGVVRAKFTSNLPTTSFGNRARVVSKAEVILSYLLIDALPIQYLKKSINCFIFSIELNY